MPDEGATGSVHFLFQGSTAELAPDPLVEHAREWCRSRSHEIAEEALRLVARERRTRRMSAAGMDRDGESVTLPKGWTELHVDRVWARGRPLRSPRGTETTTRCSTAIRRSAPASDWNVGATIPVVDGDT